MSPKTTSLRTTSLKKSCKEHDGSIESCLNQSETTSELIPWLNWVDGMIRRALAVGRTIYGEESTSDPFRGLHIAPRDVERLLAQPQGRPLFGYTGCETLPEHLPLPPSFSRLATACCLSSFDLAVVFIALAPESDLRYEKLYAYLQDDVSKKRPSVDLVLNLLCADPSTKLQMRSHFLADAPLVRHGLIHLTVESGRTDSPLLAHFLKLDDQVVGYLLGETDLDRRLQSACEILDSGSHEDSSPHEHDEAIVRQAMAERDAEPHGSVRLYFEGPDNLEKRRAARLYSTQKQRPLLFVRLAHLQAASTDFDSSLRVLFREAWLRGAVVFMEEYEAIRDSAPPLLHRQLLRRLTDFEGTIILSGSQPWLPQEEAPGGFATVSFGIPDLSRRLDYWRSSFQQQGFCLDEETLHSLAGRFQLTSWQIADAAMSALHQARWKDQSAASPTSDDLFDAARRQTRGPLAKLATLIQSTRRWEDLILPEEPIGQLQDLCAQFTHRRQVLEEWGFGRKLSYGTGITALFAGPSGTGKTMAAEIVANEVGLDLYRIDLAAVVSKYIGETEKNLDKIFTAAEQANAILFFDEADALFGKRSEVKDSHDRYANLEISYLLQKMEQYEGIAILATNLRQNLDEAFVRRLAFIVHFPFPDETMRQRIWTGIWPTTVPLHEDVDLDALAKQLKLSGGNIKNVALSAAFLAAGDGQIVTRDHIQQAAQREFQKLGKTPAQIGEGL
jgi:hypothetical protein